MDDDRITKDVQALLGLGMGDKRILEQILRASANGELISNHERAYVESLMSKQDIPAYKPDPAPVQRPQTMEKSSKSSRTIIVAGGAAAIVVTIAVAFLASTDTPTVADIEPEPLLTVTVDSTVYMTGDFILVEGSAGAAGAAVDVYISGPSGKVWQESVMPETDGSFYTLALAGHGDWSNGPYVIRAVQDDHVHESEFTFVSDS